MDGKGKIKDEKFTQRTKGTGDPTNRGLKRGEKNCLCGGRGDVIESCKVLKNSVHEATRISGGGGGGDGTCARWHEQNRL